jgi:para-nitrobenzyl esterase
MNRTHTCLHSPAAVFAALIALILATAGFTAVDTGAAAAAPSSGDAPIVTIDNGAVRGVAVPGGYEFRGLPYAAAPIGDLRWQAPRPPADWNGIRDATQFAPSCPQQVNPFLPPEPIDEDCLYLNIATSTLRHNGSQPVLVWIHGGGLTQDAGRNYDGIKLAAEGIVVVTINYRLGALGFLAHPALASRPGGPSGNYGLMDQQAALRWVQRNIGRFGGDPYNVTIAGESAGGLSVLAHLVSRGSRGLFQRAIVQSGAFALTQQSLAAAEAFGQTFATSVDCPDQSAECLRNVPVATLVAKFPGAAIPGIVDGAVLTESIGTALSAGRFARVPILNGTNHDEERLFVTLGLILSNGTSVLTVSGGTFVSSLEPVTAESYQRVIASVLGVSDARAASIAAEYPLSAYPSPTVAFSALVGDANFACTALQLNQWISQRVPTYAYEFNDDNAPLPFLLPLDPPVATHVSELMYLFGLPNAQAQVTFSPDQEALAANMRAAWASFAASGDPASESNLRWPSFGGSSQQRVLSFLAPGSIVIRDFASRHHCSFWAAP